MSRPFHFSAVLVNDAASIWLPSQGSSLQLISLFIFFVRKKEEERKRIYLYLVDGIQASK